MCIVRAGAWNRYKDFLFESFSSEQFEFILLLRNDMIKEILRKN